MKKRGFNFDNDQIEAIHRGYQDRAASRFKALVVALKDRDQKGIADPHKPIPSKHWLYGAYQLFSDLSFRGRPHQTNFDKEHLGREDWWPNVELWSSEIWLQIAQSEYTYHFGSDNYPIGEKAARRGLTWTKSSWCLGNIEDAIRRDKLLSSDGVHLWMWSLIPNAHDRVQCHWVVERQFRTLLQIPRYAQMFSGLSAREALSAVYTFHLGDCIQHPTEFNRRQVRHRTGVRMRLVAA